MKILPRTLLMVVAIIATVSMPSVIKAQETPRAEAVDAETAKAEPVKAEPTGAEPPRAEPPRAEPTRAKTPTPAKPTVRPLSVTVALVSGDEIEGTLTDTTQLQMQTSFGTASIPLSEVAGVHFASANDATTTVVMLNGDSITGATDVKLITVETEWGTASINGPSIASLMLVPGLQWNPQSGLNGKRWSLSEEKEESLPTPQRSVAAPAAAPRPNPVQGRPSFPSQGSFNSSGQFFPGN